ncbi:flagellar basal body-associated FliL family protein [Desulfotalea psychrophila]|uniref:Flagellar protein FliL n=1 Tax=Desulfotalea psychrophila (strain LSv54 / DSM 12343) TaxID=177439 RepID=Q6AJT0_DESPS|nr:flagellar basal body-associated FliL family protein [Desulfotalea psychrophila]CAG37396.1 related to flagellar protein (FliL) [Desulfotalea psychrophila LSv54]
MAEEKASPQEKNGKKKKLFLIGGIALVAIILIGIIAYLLLNKGDDTQVTDKNVPVPQVNATNLGPMVDLQDFVVNIISDEENHYVKTAITLEVSNSSASEEVGMRMPQMRDTIILIFGNKDYRELQDLQGKKQLKAEISSRINAILQTGQVVAVYFTAFVVQ